PDVMAIPRIRGGYPAEKPAEVAEILIGQSSSPGDVVADPFMGSGSVGVAAGRLGRRFLGNDINLEAVAIAARRLSEFGEGRVPPDLPAEPAPEQFDLLEEVRLKPDTTYP
ncbi:MAG: site-specific DNA-methyltransferase, partial [Acidobacteria bacterium]|nr:site-specific DNA-methyltransferase [Acidobacteriota bacterium]